MLISWTSFLHVCLSKYNKLLLICLRNCHSCHHTTTSNDRKELPSCKKTCCTCYCISRIIRKFTLYIYAKTEPQISCVVTTLISAFDFTMHQSFVSTAPSGPGISRAFNFSIFKAPLKALLSWAKIVDKSLLKAPALPGADNNEEQKNDLNQVN